MKTQIYISIFFALFFASHLTAQFTDPLAVDSDGSLPIDFNPIAAYSTVSSLKFDIDGDGFLETLSFSTTSSTGIPVIFPLGLIPANIPFPANTLSSQPNTSASLPITISFSEQVSTFSFDLIDPQYPTPETLADIAGLSLANSTLGEIIETLDNQGNPRGTVVEAFDISGNGVQVNFNIEDYDPINPIAPLPVSQLTDLSTKGGPVSAVSIPGPGNVSVVPVLRVTVSAFSSPFSSLKITAAVRGTTGVPTSGDFILLDNFDKCPDEDDDGYTTCNGDCDDSDPNNYPGNIEVCDDQDNDCDGQIDEGFDQDGDGIADCSDNCPTDPNPDQTDSDCDGVGDTCDQCPGGDDSKDYNYNGIPDCKEFPTSCEDIHPDWINSNGNGCSNNGNGNTNGNGGGNNGNSLNCGFNVFVCKIANAQTQCVNPSAVQSLINNGKFYGGPCTSCNNNLIIPMGNSAFFGAVSEGFQLYPNPARDILTLDLYNYLDQNISISIYNHLGQQVLYLPEQELHDPTLSIDLANKHLPDGIYLLSIRTPEGQQTKQFVIAR